MSKQNIEIEVPDGFEAKYNPETQKIEMIKNDDKPRTWEEFCEKYPVKCTEAYINSLSDITVYKNSNIQNARNKSWNRNNCVSREEAEAFLALMQLRQLRKAWIGDWEDTWKYPVAPNKYVIYSWDENIEIGIKCSERRPLSFPTRKMAEEFLGCFRDLIEKAKILL